MSLETEESYPEVRPTSAFVRDMLARAFEGIVRAPTLEDRFEARAAASALLLYVTDERTVTDLLTLLRRAIDLEDLVTLALAHDIPSVVDGREASFASLNRLSEYAFRRGKRNALAALLYAALLTRRRIDAAPKLRNEWLLAAIDGRRETEYDVIALVDEWADQKDADLVWLGAMLLERPTLREQVIAGFGRIAVKDAAPEADEVPF